MSSEHSRLKAYKKYIEDFITFYKKSVEDIHTLRVLSRELYSLLSADDGMYKSIKRVIKMSNKIRDLDVFLEEYLPSLPKKYREKLEMSRIHQLTKSQRDDEVEELHTYLKSLHVNEDAQFMSRHEEITPLHIKEFTLKQQELHKYRIYIKKLLAKEQNSSSPNEKKIHKLKNIKDILGSMNDNANGVKRLREYNTQADLLREIEEHTHQENLKLFDEFKRSNDAYLYGNNNKLSM